MTKKAESNEMKYFINICGKRKQVTKEEYEKRYPPITTENTETTE